MEIYNHEQAGFFMWCPQSRKVMMLILAFVHSVNQLHFKAFLSLSVSLISYITVLEAGVYWKNFLKSGKV